MKKKVGTLVRAQGKINLYLNVTAREENGYHTIESVMQSVSLCDRVTVSAARGADEIFVLDSGRVAEHGSHDELIRAGGIYAALFNLQAEKYRQ